MKHCLSYFLFCLYFIGVASSAVTGATGPHAERLDTWRFIEGDPHGAHLVDFDDADWEDVHLPHDWSIGRVPQRDAPSSRGGGFFSTGVGWYRTGIEAPEAWREQQVELLFEGSYRATEVWVNGRKVAQHNNGYLPFRADLSAFLSFGAINWIAVRVDNSRQPNSRWYTGSGLIRPVRLEVRPRLHIRPDSLFVHTAYLYDRTATLETNLGVLNDGVSAATIRLDLDIIDPEGFPVHSETVQTTIGKGEEAAIKVNMAIGNPHLWAPDSPRLYRCVARLFHEGRLLDRVERPFGIRSLAFSADEGFQLNGKPLLLVGGNVHHDNGPLGAAAFRDAEFRKVRLLREAGFNALRTAHNPPSTAFLEACDEMGLLVIAEAFDGWNGAKLKGDYSLDFESNWRRDLETFIRRDRNHPSIILWSIGNELYERSKPEAVERAREMSELIRDLDPSRAVTIGLNGLGTADKWPQLDALFAAVDVAGYNYELGTHHETDRQRVPKRVMYASESFHQESLENLRLAETSPQIIGDFLWSAMDYLGESGIGRVFAPDESVIAHWEGDHFPLHGATCGAVDLIGQPRAHLRYRQLVLGIANGIALAVVPPTPVEGDWKPSKWAVPPLSASWSWPGSEGKNLLVEVYSRHPIVRLYLNNTFLGEQRTGENEPFKATFSVPYEPGRLRAQGLVGEAVLEETVLETVGPPARLMLQTDRATIRPNNQDLVFVEVQVTDALGRLCPNAAIAVEYSLEGPAEIIAIGNGDLASRQSYQENPRLTHQGRALVVLRAKRLTGPILLRAHAASLGEASVGVSAQHPQP